MDIKEVSKYSELGITFKHIRENRGFSMKEAAAGVVTPQFLSRFEKGDTNISQQNFEGLLGNIGIDYRSFEKVRNRLYPDKLTEVQLKVSDLVYKRNYAEALSIVRKPIDDPTIPEYSILAHKAVTMAGVANVLGEEVLTDKEKQEISYIKQRLVDIETWDIIEINVYAQLLTYFDIDFIRFRTQEFLNILDKDAYTHYSTLTEYYMSALKMTITHLSREGYYEEAEDTAEKTLTLIEKYPRLAINTWDFIDISMGRACNYLRQNDVAGLELAYKIFEILDSMQKLRVLPGITARREYYFNTITQLNKTGQVFEP